MPLSWQEIEEDWLKGSSICFAPSLVVEAFNSVEAIFGREYLEKIRQRGASVTLRIVELGLILKEVRLLKDSNKLLERLGKGDPSALSEARLIAHYRQHNLPVLIEPKVSFEGVERYADFAVQYKGKLIFVEVAQPLPSDEEKKTKKAMHQMLDEVGDVQQLCKIHIYLYKLPNDKEIEKIRNACLDLVEREDQPCEYEVGKVGIILSETLDPEEEHHEGMNVLLTVSDLDIPTKFDEIYGKKPFFFDVRVNFRGPPIRNISRLLVHMPFTDLRADRILHREMRQLSPDEYNMIALDISRIPAILKRASPLNWTYLIRGRLQPDLNRRVGAVLLVRHWFSSNSVSVERKVVRHPNPYKSLPDGFLELSESRKSPLIAKSD